MSIAPQHPKDVINIEIPSPTPKNCHQYKLADIHLSPTSKLPNLFSGLRHCIEISDAKAIIVDGQLEENIKNIKTKIPVISNQSNFGNGLLDELRGKMSVDRHVHRPGPMDTIALI